MPLEEIYEIVELEMNETITESPIDIGKFKKTLLLIK